jgi:hypothetical protein
MAHRVVRCDEVGVAIWGEADMDAVGFGPSYRSELKAAH